MVRLLISVLCIVAGGLWMLAMVFAAYPQNPADTIIANPGPFTAAYVLMGIGAAIWALGGDGPHALSTPPLTFPPVEGEHLILPIRAVDGDTVEFYFLVKCHGRLHGINAPEVRGATRQEGIAAREFLEAELPRCPVRAVLMGPDKYHGRVLIRIYDVDGADLSDVMIAAGMAKPWDGKGARP